MKRIFLSICFTTMAFFAIAQQNSNIVSFDGMGDLKIGIEKTELEKLLKTKIVLKHIGIDVQRTETIKATYKGAEFEIDLMGSDAASTRLDGIWTTSPLFKTAEGIGIGSDQQTIIDKYEKHLLIIDRDVITLADA